MTTTAPTQNRFVNGTGSAGGKGGGKATTTDEADAGAKKSKKALFKSKKFIIAVVGVLAVGGIGYKMFAPKHVGPPTGGEMVALDANTLNLQDGHYLKVAISIQLVAGKAKAADFQTSRAAELTIDEFSDRTVAALSTNPARQRLVKDLEKKIKSAYPGEVYDIFLTQFVTQ